jgi:hypothetical protein
MCVDMSTYVYVRVYIYEYMYIDKVENDWNVILAVFQEPGVLMILLLLFCGLEDNPRYSWCFKFFCGDN